MEPIKINIEVNVNLGNLTLKALGLLAGRANAEPAAPASVAQKPAPAAQNEPKIEQKRPETEQKSVEIDLGHAPEKISDEQLREAVASAKSKTSAADIRAIFAEFGIRASIDCPDAKRPDLLKRLTSLAS